METLEKAPTTTTNRCGTNAGHMAHKRRNEIPCRPCRDAVNAYNAQKRLENPTAYKEYYEANREKVIARVMRSYAKNREKRIAYCQENAEHISDRNRKYRQDNPEIVRAGTRKRRAVMASVPHEPYTEAQVLERWGTDCHLCHEPVDMTATRKSGSPGWERGLHLEHVLGLTLGGHDTLDNVKPAHGKCNLTKKRKSA